MSFQLPADWQQWPPEARQRLLDQAQAALKYRDWYLTGGARANQRPPLGSWDAWLLLAGRGFGKTRTGSEWAWRKAKRMGEGSRGALVAPTAADARDVIVEGESGILACCPPWLRPKYEPSKRRITYKAIDAYQFLYSADEPDRLRGPQHHYAWVDEWAAMKQGENMMAMLDLGLRLGQHPQKVVTTTPRPHKWLKELLNRTGTHVTAGTTYENLANLAPSFKRQVLDRYEGTRLGMQELHAMILDDIEGALWNIAMIETSRIRDAEDMPPLGRVVVAIDPAATASADSDETGIIVAGTVLGSNPVEVVILADRSGKYSPHGWATVAASAADEFGADLIVAETNNGGDMVKATLQQSTPWAAYKGIHARRGKHLRAEPVSSMYEQDRCHHYGILVELEEQMTSWVPGDADSPDRIDALVYAVTELAGGAWGKARKVRT